jgi:hypothetical protein
MYPSYSTSRDSNRTTVGLSLVMRCGRMAHSTLYHVIHNFDSRSSLSHDEMKYGISLPSSFLSTAFLSSLLLFYSMHCHKLFITLALIFHHPLRTQQRQHLTSRTISKSPVALSSLPSLLLLQGRNHGNHHKMRNNNNINNNKCPADISDDVEYVKSCKFWSITHFSRIQSIQLNSAMSGGESSIM